MTKMTTEEKAGLVLQDLGIETDEQGRPRMSTASAEKFVAALVDGCGTSGDASGFVGAHGADGREIVIDLGKMSPEGLRRIERAMGIPEGEADGEVLFASPEPGAVDITVARKRPCDFVEVEFVTDADFERAAEEQFRPLALPPSMVAGGENYAAAQVTLDAFERRVRGGSGS